MRASPKTWLLRCKHNLDRIEALPDIEKLELVRNQKVVVGVIPKMFNGGVRLQGVDIPALMQGAQNG